MAELSGPDPHQELLRRLGKHKTGRGCRCVKSLGDLDPKVLRALLVAGVKQLEAQNPSG